MGFSKFEGISQEIARKYSANRTYAITPFWGDHGAYPSDLQYKGKDFLFKYPTEVNGDG